MFILHMSFLTQFQIWSTLFISMLGHVQFQRSPMEQKVGHKYRQKGDKKYRQKCCNEYRQKYRHK